MAGVELEPTTSALCERQLIHRVNQFNNLALGVHCSLRCWPLLITTQACESHAQIQLHGTVSRAGTVSVRSCCYPMTGRRRLSGWVGQAMVWA